MGNRAIITTRKNFLNNGVGVYLHWNGGRDSVTAFLEYCKLRDFKTPESDSYGWARLCQVISNFFEAGGLSIGIDTLDKLPSGEYCDNGVYIIENWQITGRECWGDYEEQMEYNLMDMLVSIDNSQPQDDQLGEYITAEEVPTNSLNVGDVIYLRNYDSKMLKEKIVGIGENKICNGFNVEGVPYIARYGVPDDYSNNINNYLRTDTVRLVSRRMEQ